MFSCTALPGSKEHLQLQIIYHHSIGVLLVRHPDTEQVMSGQPTCICASSLYEADQDAPAERQVVGLDPDALRFTAAQQQQRMPQATQIQRRRIILHVSRISRIRSWSVAHECGQSFCQLRSSPKSKIACVKDFHNL